MNSINELSVPKNARLDTENVEIEKKCIPLWSPKGKGKMEKSSKNEFSDPKNFYSNTNNVDIGTKVK